MQATGHIRKRENEKGEIAYQVIVEMQASQYEKRKRIYKTIKGTKKQAEALLRQMIAEVESQSYIKPSKKTVGEWMKEWMELYDRGEEVGYYH